MSRMAWIVIVAAALLAGCPDRPERTDGSGKVRVVASLFPLADLAGRIGGADAEVACLLQAGQTPHDFRPNAAQAERCAEADLIVLVGLGIDAWAADAARASRGRAEVLRLAECADLWMPVLAPDDKDNHTDAHDGHGEAPSDPHVWLDPVYMQSFARAIADALIAARPAARDGFVRRRDAVLADLKALDAEYRTVLAAVAGKHFVTFHPAFSYVARRYGLVQMSLHTADAAGFGPEHMEQVADFVRRHRVRAILAEPQFPPDKLRALARATGAAVGQLDPLGNPDRPGYDSYLAMMRSNLAALAGALKDQP